MTTLIIANAKYVRADMFAEVNLYGRRTLISLFVFALVKETIPLKKVYIQPLTLKHSKTTASSIEKNVSKIRLSRTVVPRRFRSEASLHMNKTFRPHNLYKDLKRYLTI
jgi:hypothetical protein